MPVILPVYKPTFPFTNGHISTIYYGLFRKVVGIAQVRERITLSDGDFLDLDWSYGAQQNPSKKVVLLMHGLEGNAQRHYIVGSAKMLNANGWDVCAINFRSCSGETNKLYRSYHSGATEDLREVISHVLENYSYKKIALKGYSLGGNLTLKYLGENNDIPHEITAAVAVSVPVDLKDSCDQLLSPKNILYAKKFKKNLLHKLREKQGLFPERISEAEITAIKTLKNFDDVYTGPAHGFKDAEDYYKRCSCKPLLRKITVPTLIINAANDSFLGSHCYPIKEAEENTALFLEIPKYGGHVGFWGKENVSYVEVRAVEFLENY